MQTIRETWRQRHRDEVLRLYDDIELMLSHPDGIITSEAAGAIAVQLGLEERQYELSDDKNVIIYDLADSKLDLSTKEATLDFQREEVKRWKSEISKPAKWGKIRPVDEHVLHFHMKAIHGESLSGLIRNASWEGLIPWHIDVIETDELSVHLISSQLHKLDDDLFLDKERSTQERENAIKKAVDKIRKSELSWAVLPGSARRSNEITANFRNDTVRVEGNEVKVSFEGLPETKKLKESYIGRPVHEIVDINGFRNDKLIITEMTLREMSKTMTFIINRSDITQRRRITLS